MVTQCLMVSAGPHDEKRSATGPWSRVQKTHPLFLLSEIEPCLATPLLFGGLPKQAMHAVSARRGLLQCLRGPVDLFKALRSTTSVKLGRCLPCASIRRPRHRVIIWDTRTSRHSPPCSGLVRPGSLRFAVEDLG